MWLYWHNELVATFFLGAIGGYAVGSFLRLLGRQGLFSFLVYGTLTLLLVVALARGYSYFLERLTWNLSYYIAQNPAGFLGLLFGFVLSRPWERPAQLYREY
jgi:hypothetical protein